MKILKLIESILFILRIILIIPDYSYARRVQTIDNDIFRITNALIPIVEYYIEHNNYEEAKKLIYTHFQSQFETLTFSLVGRSLDSSEQIEIQQCLGSPELTTLEIMTSLSA